LIALRHELDPGAVLGLGSAESEEAFVMKRTFTAVAASLVALSAAPSAMAQPKGDFGQQGQFIISADRLFQLFAYDNWSYADFQNQGNGVKSSTTSVNESSLSILYGNTATQVERFYTVPRAGFDYVIVPNVTLGGNLIAVFSLGGSTKQETDFTDGTNRTFSQDNPSIVGFGIAPRAGYVLNLSDMFSLWLRGGISWYTASTKSTTGNGNVHITDNVNQFGFDLEPQLVFHPIPHVGFTAGIYADIAPIGGRSVDTNTNGTDVSVSGGSSMFYLGLDIAMLAYF
jgi:hypothetical protein